MENNMPFGQVYFKGSGIPNGIPVYLPNDGLFTLGGYQSSSDTGGSAYFGNLMSSNPSDPDGAMYVGIPSGYVPRGIVLYDAGVAQNDPAKNNYMLQGAPLTVVFRGAIWYYSWNVSATGAIAPVSGSVLIVNNTTGEIQFVPSATSAPGGWTKLTNCKVKAVNDDGSAAMCYISL